MTHSRNHPALAASIAVLIAPAIQAAGVYSASTGTTPGAPDNPIPRAQISVWESAVVSYDPSPGVGTSFRNPNTGLASLGDLYNPLSPPAGSSPATHGFIGTSPPGSITLSFTQALYDGPGADFAVFENGFTYGPAGSLFAELAYVEVSSDGVNFARFDSISLNTAPTAGSGAFAAFDMTNVYNLAGKHAAGWGTPFDLTELANHPLVLNGLLDLSGIGYVRLVDIAGSGLLTSGGSEIPGIAKDSLGNPILDNWITTGSGGFDYLGLPTGAIGGIHVIPEPGSLAFTALLAVLAGQRRRR